MIPLYLPTYCLLLNDYYVVLSLLYFIEDETCQAAYYLLLALTDWLFLSRTKSVSSGSSSVRLASSRCDARSSTVGLPHACKHASSCVSKYGRQ